MWNIAGPSLAINKAYAAPVGIQHRASTTILFTYLTLTCPDRILRLTGISLPIIKSTYSSDILSYVLLCLRRKIALHYTLTTAAAPRVGAILTHFINNISFISLISVNKCNVYILLLSEMYCRSNKKTAIIHKYTRIEIEFCYFIRKYGSGHERTWRCSFFSC